MGGKAADARYRARLRGEIVPYLKKGPKPGFKQTPEHIALRSRWGEQHHAWKGDNVQAVAGNKRAIRRYPARPCSDCGASKSDRHHIDGNTTNNEIENIAFLCRRCHMTHDGRLEAIIKQGTKNLALVRLRRSNGGG